MSCRDLGVESLRVLLMFGICLLHSITMCGHGNTWLSRPLLACVDAFVFISGYYGIKFKPSKLLRLYAVGLWCAIIAVFLPMLFGVECPLSWEEFWRTYIDRFWFLHAYAVMMLLSPLVDSSMGIKQTWTVIFLVFGWGGLYCIPYFGRLIPRTAGVTAYSGLTLFGVYVAARLFRKYQIEQWFDGRRLAALFGCLCVVAGIGWYEYCSPVALGLAMIAFEWGRRIRIGAIGQLLAPSMFSVYLLHSNMHGFALMNQFEGFVISKGIPVFVSYFLVAISVFLLCVLIDVPRRVVCRVSKRHIDNLCNRVDWYIDRLVVFVETYCNHGGGGQ